MLRVWTNAGVIKKKLDKAIKASPLATKQYTLNMGKHLSNTIKNWQRGHNMTYKLSGYWSTDLKSLQPHGWALYFINRHDAAVAIWCGFSAGPNRQHPDQRPRFEQHLEAEIVRMGKIDTTFKPIFEKWFAGRMGSGISAGISMFRGI